MSKIKEFILKFRIRYLAIAAIPVSIPIMVKLLNAENTTWEVCFYILLLIISIAISMSVEQLRTEIQAIKQNQINANQNYQVLKDMTENQFGETQAQIEDLSNTLHNLIGLMESQSNYQIELVNRNRHSAKQGYAKILKIMNGAKSKIKILTPDKSTGFRDPNRERYLKNVEILVKKKVRTNRNFVFRRIVPTDSEHISPVINVNQQLLSHCTRIGFSFPTSSEIGTRLVEKKNIQMSFIIVDDVLIILFPKLQKGGQVGDDCSLYAIVKDKRKFVLNTLEKQFDLLYNNGNMLNSFSPLSGN